MAAPDRAGGRARARQRPARPRLALAPMWPALGEDPGEIDGAFLLSPWREGWRCIAVLDDRIRLRARGGSDLAPRLPALAAALAACRIHASAARPTVLDALVVGIDGAEGDDRERAGAAAIAGEHIAIVDVLCRDGRDLTGLALADRQSHLRDLRLPAGDARIGALPAARGDARAEVAQAGRGGAAGHAGLLARRAASPYRPGVWSREWIAFPERVLSEMVIAGITRAGALVLGRASAHGLAFAGLTWPSRVWSRLAARCREGPPAFALPPTWPSLGPVAWARPELWVAVAPDVRPASGRSGPRWRFVRVQEDLSA